MLSASLGSAAPALAGQGCSISNLTPLEFDTGYDPFVSEPTDGRASFIVTCALPTTTTLSLLYSHRLTGTSGVLRYDLSATPDRMTVWGNGSDGTTITRSFAAGTPTTVYVYARIPRRQRVGPGRFNDSFLVVTEP
ncbi:MAG: spore coat protein U domain-containing protein [Vulcanimicrobiaceae bacterium]